MKKVAILTAAAVVLGGILAGCNSEATDETTNKDPDATLSQTPTDDETPVVHTNAEGKVLCPVMNAVVEDVSGMKYQDYEGKRYYFCCDGCPETFAKDPAKYASTSDKTEEGTGEHTM